MPGNATPGSIPGPGDTGNRRPFRGKNHSRRISNRRIIPEPMAEGEIAHSPVGTYSRHYGPKRFNSADGRRPGE